MNVESGEKRDFLPDFIAHLEKVGAEVFLEEGYGSKMGIGFEEYKRAATGIHTASHAETFQKDIILVLRCPSDEELHLIQPGSILVSMLHYPTRLERSRMIHSLGIEAVSLDSLTDDSGRRLVENLSAVAWNGMEVAFKVLEEIYPEPGFSSPKRKPIHVTLLGSGAVGMHVMQAAIRYGDAQRWKTFADQKIPGVEVTVIDYDLTTKIDVLLEILPRTDILVDATQRPDPSVPVISNDLIRYLPLHSVLLDLSVDPYMCSGTPFSVKGIEGIPHGNLNQYIFKPDDPAFETIPSCINSAHRRHSVSCYSWPGIHPRECMRVYGTQIKPVMRMLLKKRGFKKLQPDGRYFERAIHRASLSHWIFSGQEKMGAI